MSGLLELQRCFADAIRRGEIGALAGEIRPGGLTGARRLGIYRNNVLTNQREALRTLYPVIERLVGAEFFEHLVAEYLRCHGSPAGDLNRIGEHLAAFLSEFAPVRELVYLPDTARLEWLAHRVYHGPEHRPLDLERLASVMPERYEVLRFALHPATALFASRYPVHRIWQVNQPDYAGEEGVDLASGDVRLLVQRREGRVELRALDAADWAFLQAVAAGGDFGQACDAALAAQADFDLDTALARLIQDRTLVDFVSPVSALD